MADKLLDEDGLRCICKCWLCLPESSFSSFYCVHSSVCRYICFLSSFVCLILCWSIKSFCLFAVFIVGSHPISVFPFRLNSILWACIMPKSDKSENRRQSHFWLRCWNISRGSHSDRKTFAIFLPFRRRITWCSFLAHQWLPPKRKKGTDWLTTPGTPHPTAASFIISGRTKNVYTYILPPSSSLCIIRRFRMFAKSPSR